jgi:hypothetical protein
MLTWLRSVNPAKMTHSKIAPFQRPSCSLHHMQTHTMDGVFCCASSNVCCSGCFSSRSNCAHLASLARESGDSTRRVSPPATQLLVVRLSLDGRVQHSARAGRCDGGREKLARRDVATGVDVAAAARCRGGARGDGVRKLAWRRGAPNSERFCVTTAVTGNRISCSSVCVARRRARAEGPVGRRGSRVCGVRSCAVTCVCK